eukprot:CAMPEP_0113507866 /NCGR_PEP_ID=MMETSP0014_2-20120614/36697_1 /TAXON_ID=2857 /ORGANISM="Nitzschia sp." /LENGTH=480 /DNA_ID=CAMNT_0000403511 /DNA_START=389 /DNA_END=1827 /DNA_ORIENTATION=- /assembly_acc=CAM_ASM_000159
MTKVTSVQKQTCIDAWAKLKAEEKYKEKGGALLFQNLFAAEPQIKVLFGFPIDVDPKCDELLRSRRFAMHASFLMEMIEKTVSLMEEDNKTLTKSMMELGQKHVAFGVTPSYFPLMTDALIKMLKDMLPSFSADEESAFKACMEALIADMVKGQQSIDKGLAATKKVVVINSWEKLTKIDDYESKGGVLLFQHLFELCPEAKILFGFPEDIDPHSDKLLENKRFLAHASFLLSMIGKTVKMIGQDDDKLAKDLLELGRKHVTYGVKAEYFPFMTKAIMQMMKELLGGEFSESEQEAWEDILATLIADMVKGQRTLDIGLAAANKNVTTRNWDQIAEIDDYDEVCGLVIFEKLFAVCPEALPLFGFPPGTKVDDIARSKRLLVHASFIVEMIEKALGMLGSDDTALAAFMEDLGSRHITYGVKPEYLTFMHVSILHMLKTKMADQGKPMSDIDAQSWDVVLSSLVSNMSRVQRSLEMKKLA